MGPPGFWRRRRVRQSPEKKEHVPAASRNLGCVSSVLLLIFVMALQTERERNSVLLLLFVTALQTEREG